MRLWTIHPKYLDAKGLVALWREALLAQKVLRGETAGYRNHPQLIRFRNMRDPQSAIARYLWVIYLEAQCRGYNFDESKIGHRLSRELIKETDGQLLHEWRLFKSKLAERSPELHAAYAELLLPDHHPLFCIHKGEAWEREKASIIRIVKDFP